jgi:Rrf2 family protein
MISTTSEYALRALVQLAQQPKDNRLGGKELSAKLDIPADYLSKVMTALRNAGFIDATRGQGGGYRLIQPSKKISLVNVVELFEGVYTRPHCFLGENHVCSDDHPCAAHEYFRGVRASYIRFLERTTIAALAKKDLQLHGKPGNKRNPKPT